MRFVVVDLADQLLLFSAIACRLGVVQGAEQVVEFPGIRLLQEGIELFDQVRDRGFLVHGLVGKRAELGAQGCHHPSREVEVAAFGGAEVFLDRDELLLTDETVPAAQRLSVLGGVGIVGGHVVAHDLGRVASDVQTGMETVLSAHTGSIFRFDG